MTQRRGFSPASGELPEGATGNKGSIHPSLAGVDVFELADGAPVPRWTSGRETWVFRAEKPEQLRGYHPQLIAAALAADERLHYLLYSPICDGQEGPFGVGGRPGSYAVGITSGRLVISHDPHAEGSLRSALRIDLGAISALEVGCALALGWFVVRLQGPDGACSRAVTFGGQGIGHFREVVRAYRRLGLEAHARRAEPLTWPAVWEGVPAYVRTELEPLVDAEEEPLASLRSPERWTSERRFWGTRPVCASTVGLLVATPRGLLWAASEPRLRPEGLTFGVNVAVVRPDRVVDAAIGTRGSVGVLRLSSGGPPNPHEMKVPFDPEDIDSAKRIVDTVAGWRGAP